MDSNNQRAFVCLLFIVFIFKGCCSFFFRLCVSHRIISKLVCLFLGCFALIQRLESIILQSASQTKLLTVIKYQMIPFLFFLFASHIAIQLFNLKVLNVVKQRTWSWLPFLIWPNTTASVSCPDRSTVLQQQQRGPLKRYARCHLWSVSMFWEWEARVTFLTNLNCMTVCHMKGRRQSMMRLYLSLMSSVSILEFPPSIQTFWILMKG